MESTRQAEPAKKFNFVTESIKCLLGVVLVLMAGYGLYVVSEPLLNYAGTVLPPILKVTADIAVTIISAAYRFLVSVHLYVQMALFCLGLWASCVGIKLLETNQKFDVVQKIETAASFLISVQLGFVVFVDIYAYISTNFTMLVFLMAMAFIQFVLACHIDMRCTEIRIATNAYNNDAETPAA